MNDRKQPDKPGFRRGRVDIREIFQAGLEEADAGRLIRDRVRLDGEILRAGEMEHDLSGVPRIFVAGFGKASARMAAAVEDILGDRITDGLVIVKYGHGARLKRIQVQEAGHPVPDLPGVRATEELVRRLGMFREDDLIIFLVSGGGSSLLVLPAEGVTLEEKILTTRLLLSSGASIEEINTVRRHISAVKGGKLLQATHPAASLGLILSDVIGDRPETIASGPTVPMSRDYTSALGIIRKYGLEERVPEKILRHLQKGSAGEKSPVPGGHKSTGIRVDNMIIGTNESLLEGARRRAEELGYRVRVLTRELHGEARNQARKMVSLAVDTGIKMKPEDPPVCILAGGETTVTIKGDGRGGRCQEFALSAALSLGNKNIVLLAAGSDGTDGPTDAAGAIVDGETFRRARERGLVPADFLERNDSHTFFESLGDLLVTGPTGTNVMDLYACLIYTIPR